MTAMVLLSWQALGLNTPQSVSLLQASEAVVYAGDVIILQGRSGSGKSLLLRCLGRLEDFYCQNMMLQGVSHQSISAPLWRQRVALVAQQAVMISGNVEDNLRLPFAFRAHHQALYCQRWQQACLALFNKGADFLQRDIAKLSGGERQIVNLLRTLQLKPQVLLLDEPTAALDDKSRDVMQTLLLEWVEQEATARAIIWISHDSEQQQSIGSRLWQMKTNGRLVCDEENNHA